MDKLKRLGLLLRRTAGRPPSSRTVRVCPRCGSANLKFSSKLDVWLTPRRYICSDCGYIGPVVLEIEKTDEEKQAPSS